ncbi:hypothetical protein RchiOBHm_Chr1g0327771 [Rosa chinensis]|uniref:Uncharacterized protein n=1 Tax=Rosa chinensis TaxID=74649 RepID=A0A2P6SAM8_ROSCH|nr:hypothetical protein RchiOBHm_Chr1g0327771 [Rosa chinensis]
MSRAPLVMGCCSLLNVNQFIFQLTLMQIGLVVQRLVGLHLATLCISVPISSLGVLKSNLR